MVKRPWFLLKLGFTAFILVAIFLPGYSKYHQLLERCERDKQRIEELKQANERLAQEEELLRSDPLYLEKVAREKLGVAKREELIFRFGPEQPEKQTSNRNIRDSSTAGAGFLLGEEDLKQND